MGVAGWIDDDLALVREWGFELSLIARPVAIWHGATDTLVPVAHGRWLAAQVNGARGHFLEGHDHFTVPVVMMDRIVGELVELAN
jgi:pimeloyl-ACP methyl ester carboxylesterase